MRASGGVLIDIVCFRWTFGFWIGVLVWYLQHSMKVPVHLHLGVNLVALLFPRRVIQLSNHTRLMLDKRGMTWDAAAQGCRSCLWPGNRRMKSGFSQLEPARIVAIR